MIRMIPMIQTMDATTATSSREEASTSAGTILLTVGRCDEIPPAIPRNTSTPPTTSWTVARDRRARRSSSSLPASCRGAPIALRTNDQPQSHATAVSGLIKPHFGHRLTAMARTIPHRSADAACRDSHHGSMERCAGDAAGNGSCLVSAGCANRARLCRHRAPRETPGAWLMCADFEVEAHRARGTSRFVAGLPAANTSGRLDRSSVL